ncbi:MAG: ATP-binding protein [Alphaproteobacteria bacterium]|nr:ATP-binding protein [Alphaproteobacteria bacterium]
MIWKVSDASHVGEVRRAATALAENCGLDETRAGRVAIVATEMATNLLKHAGGGDIVVQRVADKDGDCLELMAFDAGPGIASPERAFEDGFSTAGSPGTGLGAIRRQCDHLALWSRPRLGTAIMARFKVGPATEAAASVGYVMAPYPGETAIGDAWAFHAAAAGPRLLVADGSGHGPQAAAAAAAALRTFDQHRVTGSVQLVEAIHGALRPTRGAAIAVAEVDLAQRLVRFVGIGNIAGALITGDKCQRMVSHNGIAGHVASRIREFTYPFSGAATLVLHSDGLSAKWNPDAFPGLMSSHPSLIAGMLFREHRRERDDACVVAMRVVA